ncbi:MAG: ECF transporter S component [Oscillospiraceae bacterium]|nr:ECF transporter S component [Oscillospiraceae bacterium]
MERNKIYEMVLYALFIAITAILGLTPLGFIPLIVSITTTHMPVIIGSYSLGAKGGAILGGVFGITSLIQCFRNPVDVTAQLMLGKSTGGFGLYNLFLIVAIIFLPRILCGVFSALTYKGVSKFDKSRVIAMGTAAVVGSMTNTIFYLGGLYLFAFDTMSAAYGVSTYGALLKIILGVVGFNGVIEAIAALIICTAVGKAVAVARDKGFIK